jgi:hypothetical protein
VDVLRASLQALREGIQYMIGLIGLIGLVAAVFLTPLLALYLGHLSYRRRLGAIAQEGNMPATTHRSQRR